MNTHPTPSPEPSIAWWRVPQMWLVVGGPVVVVIAAIVTAVIAMNNADPVLNKAQYERDLSAAHALQGEARDEAEFQLMPAHQARNHATTQTAPPSK